MVAVIRAVYVSPTGIVVVARRTGQITARIPRSRYYAALVVTAVRGAATEVGAAGRHRHVACVGHIATVKVHRVVDVRGRRLGCVTLGACYSRVAQVLIVGFTSGTVKVTDGAVSTGCVPRWSGYRRALTVVMAGRCSTAARTIAEVDVVGTVTVVHGGTVVRVTARAAYGVDTEGARSVKVLVVGTRARIGTAVAQRAA